MNTLNNVRFILDSYYGFNDENMPNEEFEDNYLYYYLRNIKFIENNQIVAFNQTHNQLNFKNKTNRFEFLKCPVNPQQTSFKYIKLNKKNMFLSDVLKLIEDFYSWASIKAHSFSIENIIDIENDDLNIVRNIRNNIEKHNTVHTWAHLLGSYRKFIGIIEGELNGFKTYQLLFAN